MHRWLVGFIIVLFPLAFLWAASSDERIEELPKKYRVWLEEEVVYIITDIEKETFLRLESEEAREAFIQAFWKKRDTNPQYTGERIPQGALGAHRLRQ